MQTDIEIHNVAVALMREAVEGDRDAAQKQILEATGSRKWTHKILVRLDEIRALHADELSQHTAMNLFALERMATGALALTRSTAAASLQ